MKECTALVVNTVLDHINGVMAQSILEIGSRTRSMESASINGSMGGATRENGKKTIWRD